MKNGAIMIGWARGEITPPRKTLVQGQFHTRISDQVVSPLTATALALEVKAADGTSEQAVFLSCDLASEGFKEDLFRSLEGRCLDLDRQKLTVNCTHTHNAPSMSRGCYDEPDNDPEFMNPDEYRLWLAARLADIIERSWQGRQSGGVSRGFGYAVVGRCRRAVYADGSARMYGDTNRPDFIGFESCDDHAVNMIFAHDEAGALTGIIVNLACPSQCEEGGTYFSADFWHNVRESIRERYGPSVHLLPQCAPAGDMSPHLLSDQKEEKDLRDRLGFDDKGIIAHRIMAAIEEGLANASPIETTAEFDHQVKTLRLPRLMVTEDEYEMEKRIGAMSDEERARQSFAFQRLWPFGLVCDLIARYEQQEAHPVHETEAHFIRLGDVVFATNPFELFVDYGAQIRCRSRALQTFLIQLADGSGDGFYLPTQRALDGGHYSALIKSNWVGPDGGKMLVEETVRSIDELFGNQTYPRTR
ncbi:MAG: hypothetical protein SCM11_17480 [Bacillota bacterium]|nr:hypothetical protein [Bacillota bacterium]